MISADNEYNNPGFHQHPPIIENVNNTKDIENKIWTSLHHRDNKLDELEKVMDDVQAKIDTFRKLSFVNSPNDDSDHRVSPDMVVTGSYCRISPLDRTYHSLSTSILDDRVPPDKSFSTSILDDRVPPDKVVTG